MSNNKMSRKDFLSMSAVLGVSSLVGSSSLMTSCSGGGAAANAPIERLQGVYVPVLNDKADDGRELKAGVIGCGGRGSGAIVNLLEAANGITVTAFPNHIPKDIDKVTLANLCVPSPDELCIHFFNRFKRSVIKADYILMSEVII